MRMPSVIKGDEKWFFKTLAVILLSLDFASLYILTFLWKLEVIHYAVSVFVVSLVAGFFLKDPGRSIIYCCFCVVLGVLIGLGILLLPSLVYGQTANIDILLEIIGGQFTRLLFLGGGLGASFVGGIIGSFLSDLL